MSQERPLEGVRVLDATRAYAGPTATLYLAELGAEVIKVEATNRPDMPTRVLHFADNEPGDVPWERSAFFHRLNVGKKGITLDLTQDRGVELFKRLAAESDVVAENYRPGVMDRFGLGYDTLSELNPKLVMVSMSGFGGTGPRKDWASYYPGMEAMSTLTSVTGYADGHTLNSSTGYGDWALGSAGAAAVLMALHQRHRTGRGQYVDVAGRDAVLVHLGEAMLDHAMNQRSWTPQGNHSPGMAPHDVYACDGKDDWVAIAVESEAEWAAFCEVLGNPAWMHEEQYGDAASRYANQDAMREGIEAFTSTLSPDEVAKRLLAAGVPAAPVQDPGSILLDRQILHRGYYRVADHPEVGRRLFPRQFAAAFSEFELAPLTGAPTLGQHGREVLGTILGLSEAELDSLEAEGVIGTEPKKKSQNTRPNPLDGWKQGGGRVDDDYLEKLRPAYGPLGSSGSD